MERGGLTAAICYGLILILEFCNYVHILAANFLLMMMMFPILLRLSFFLQPGVARYHGTDAEALHTNVEEIKYFIVNITGWDVHNYDTEGARIPKLI